MAIDPKLVKRIKESEGNFLASITGRGGIIESTTWLENTLTDIIAWCCYPTTGDFLNKDINDQLDKNGIILKSLILVKLEFHEKIMILEKIIRLKDEGVWKKDRKLIKEIVKELNKVREFRNVLAHSPCNTSKEFYDSAEKEKAVGSFSSFYIIEYKNGEAKEHMITHSKIKTEVMRMDRVWYKLLQLWALLRKDTKDAEACEALSSMSEKDIDLILKHYGFK